MSSPTMTTAADVAAQAASMADGARGGRVIVGVAGPPGAGKSTLATAAVAAARAQRGGQWAAYLPMDGYHLSSRQLLRLGLLEVKGAPATFDADGYAATLARVAADDGRDIYVPGFDRDLDEPVAAWHLIPASARLVVTEGNYLAVAEPRWRAARAHLDFLWYLQEADDVRAQRLTQRQLAGGRTPEQAQAWVERSDGPNGELVKRSRQLADAVIMVRG